MSLVDDGLVGDTEPHSEDECEAGKTGKGEVMLGMKEEEWGAHMLQFLSDLFQVHEE